MKNNFNYHFSNCSNNGVMIYPKYISKDCKIGDVCLKRNNWYVCVNNNGKEMFYKKSIGVGLVLKRRNSKKIRLNKNYNNWDDAIKKTYEYWSNKIDNL